MNAFKRPKCIMSRQRAAGSVFSFQFLWSDNQTVFGFAASFVVDIASSLHFEPFLLQQTMVLLNEWHDGVHGLNDHDLLQRAAQSMRRRHGVQSIHMQYVGFQY